MMALLTFLKSAHIRIPSVFFPVTTMGDTRAEASTRSMRPVLSRRSNSAETNARTAKGKRCNFWRTGFTCGQSFLHILFQYLSGMWYWWPWLRSRHYRLLFEVLGQKSSPCLTKQSPYPQRRMWQQLTHLIHTLVLAGIRVQVCITVCKSPDEWLVFITVWHWNGVYKCEEAI